MSNRGQVLVGCRYSSIDTPYFLSRRALNRDFRPTIRSASSIRLTTCLMSSVGLLIRLNSSADNTRERK
jgi:hypothetical protein